MVTKKIKIGSRESKLAVAQSRLVMAQIQEKYPDIELELITMKTTGDMILDRKLDEIGGKDLFVKELDRALREGVIDYSVHSLKDLSMETPSDLPLVAFSKREDPRDVLILPKGCTELDTSKPLGSSSARRALQLRALYKGVSLEPIRGNVITRLEKLDRGEFGALILAFAGLKRLGLEKRASRVFEADEIIPAAGQGIIVIQGREGEDNSFLDAVRDERAEWEALAERSFVRTLDGGCSSPIAAFASIEEGLLKLRGLYYMEESDDYVTGVIEGDPENGEALGKDLALQLKG